VEGADCFDFAARIPGGAVNLLWLDGPYNMGKAEWDSFATDAACLDFYRRVFAEAARVLAPNGSLYVCTSTALGARMECTIAERFTVLNNIRWAKPSGSTKAEMFDKEICRAFFPSSETIIFAEQLGADGVAMGASGYTGAVDEMRGFVFEPLRAYLDGERLRAGFDRAACDRACGNQMAGHYFSRVQWALPTDANYQRLRDAFNARGGAYLRKDYAYLRKDYEELRKDYEYLRKDYEELRRHFSVSTAVPYTDTWTYATVGAQDGKHLCEKPAAMLRDVIAASSRDGDVVCDWFGGSFVAGEQAILQGRRFLGCDTDPEWARRGMARIERAEREPHRSGQPIVAVGRHPAQGLLL
jgi:site-specific DNA-methyltransferase (adenine-specific)